MKNSIAKGRLAVWLATEERLLSVELHLCMKGYCWRESRAKIVAFVKTKMQLVLFFAYEKNTLEMNKFTENECLPSFELKFKVLEIWGNHYTQKYEKTHWRKKNKMADIHFL